MSLPKNVVPGKSNCRIAATESRASTNYERLTGPGRSAIAVIELRGDLAADIISRCFAPATKLAFSAGQIRYGTWTGSPSQLQVSSDVNATNDDVPTRAAGSAPKEVVAGESVVVTPCGDEHFEIHCHGGPAAVQRVEEDLNACGASPADPFSPGREAGDATLIHEAESVLTQCLTVRIAAIAMNQVRGALLDWARQWQSSLSTANLSAFDTEAQSLLAEAKRGLRLAEPFRVVFVGPPNVGKSSLMNAMVGFDRSITLDSAGTTRDVLHAETVIDGLPLRFSDTAGIRDSNEPVERQGIARARLAADEADLLLLVSEPQPGGGISRLPHLDTLERDSAPSVRILNKLDRSTSGTASDSEPGFDVRTNALSGEGVQDLMHCIADRLGRQLPAAEGPVVLNPRQADVVSQITGAATLDQRLQLLNILIGRALE
ncbi:MAG: GTPase [Rubripirellula sp.]